MSSRVDSLATSTSTSTSTSTGANANACTGTGGRVRRRGTEIRHAGAFGSLRRRKVRKPGACRAVIVEQVLLVAHPVQHRKNVAVAPEALLHTTGASRHAAASLSGGFVPHTQCLGGETLHVAVRNVERRGQRSPDYATVVPATRVPGCRCRSDERTAIFASALHVGHRATHDVRVLAVATAELGESRQRTIHVPVLGSALDVLA